MKFSFVIPSEVEESLDINCGELVKKLEMFRLRSK